MNGFRLSRPFIAPLLCGALCASPLRSPAGPDEPAYEMGFRNVTRLHSDLLVALDRKQRPLAPPQLALLAAVRLPCVASGPASATGATVRVSAGCIDLLNRVAHARAIDQSQRGFFAGYSIHVAQLTRNTPVPDFDTRAAREAWDLDTMNRQASHFNQMAGALVAIDLAHHYLGHYRDRASEFPADAAFPMPITAVITEQQWRAAVLRGARNALDCGLAVDGLKALFEFFDQMPNRPAWAAYFIHPQAKVSKINAELVRLEQDFFAMNRRMQRLSSSGMLEFPR